MLSELSDFFVLARMLLCERRGQLVQLALKRLAMLVDSATQLRDDSLDVASRCISRTPPEVQRLSMQSRTKSCALTPSAPTFERRDARTSKDSHFLSLR